MHDAIRVHSPTPLTSLLIVVEFVATFLSELLLSRSRAIDLRVHLFDRLPTDASNRQYRCRHAQVRRPW